MNVVILTGRIGKDPETKVLAEGKQVSNFTLATNDGKDLTSWHSVVCWNKTSEIVDRYCKKGSKIGIEGTLRYRTYEDKEGNKKYITEVLANRIELMDSKEKQPTDFDKLNEEVF